MFFNKKFILASNSKSRFFILKNNKLNFRQVSPVCDEETIKKQKIKEKLSPKKISLCLAMNKAASISKKYYNSLVIGSDTVIDLNNKIIEKAKNIKRRKKNSTNFRGKNTTYILVPQLIIKTNLFGKQHKKQP